MAKLKSPKRQVAHKLWISDIVNSNFVKKEGWDPSYVEVGDKNVSRVNVIATVVGKFVSEDANYATINLDDGTETIRAKAFGPDVSKVMEVNVGNIIRFIGKVRKYEEEVYLSPEIARQVDDPNWVLVRKLELKEPKKIKEEKVEKVSEEKEVVETVKEEKVEEEEDTGSDFLAIIKKLDSGQGADMEKVIEESGLDSEEAKNFLFSLLKRGEIFEPKKGKLKVLD
ncbi:MAG: hypothetical protein JSW73_03945 [Candidatus Woesearchaeota archaeon]|nr:MAG: hypothetical protein JSW73_03945 [Candidatus Woesearchaeota archaeon]